MSLTARRLARALTAAALTLGAPALAQPVAPPPLASPEADAAQTLLPDALFRSLGDRVVALRLTSGGEVVGRVLGVEPTLLVVSTSPGNQVITLPRATVAEVRLMAAAPTFPPPIYVNRDGEPVLQPAPRQRHVGLNLSAAPGFLLDLDYGRFRAFANLGIVLPLATNGALVPFSLGLGGGIPVSARNPGLKLDLFAFFSVIGDAYHKTTSYNDTLVSFGAGLGLHNTWRNGLTLGFTVPVLGYSVFTAQSNTGSSSSSSSSKTSTGIAYFYLAGVESLPIGFIGYRF